MEKNVNIITDLDERKIVIINDIRFQSRRKIDWKKVEEYLKEYIGEYFEIVETSEKIFIGSDFPDEFSHSNDTKGLKRSNMKAKGNIERYNIFSTRMFVRCDENGKLYLYDLVRTKKETSKPHKQ